MHRIKDFSFLGFDSSDVTIKFPLRLDKPIRELLMVSTGQRDGVFLFRRQGKWANSGKNGQIVATAHEISGNCLHSRDFN